MTSDMDDQPEDPGQRQAQQAYGEGETPFLPREREPMLERAVPVSKQLARYRVRTARRDALAGVTVAALAIPSAMAYAELAGVDPVNGLYALLLPAVAYALLGSFSAWITSTDRCGRLSTPALSTSRVVTWTRRRPDAEREPCDRRGRLRRHPIGTMRAERAGCNRGHVAIDRGTHKASEGTHP